MPAGMWRPLLRGMLAIVIYVAIGIVVAYVARFHDFWIPPFGWLFAGYAIGIVCHELGHALCAVIGSIPVQRIQIGIGPVLLRRRLHETLLELRLFPLSGVVEVYPVADIRGSHWALFLLGGILGNTTIIAAIAGLNAVGALPEHMSDALGAVMLAQVIIIAATITPYRSTLAGRPVRSDGMQFLQFVWQGRDPRMELKALYADLVSGYSVDGDSPATLSSAAERALYQLCRADRWADGKARREVRESLLHELERGELSREDQMLVLDSLATDGLLSGDPTLHAQLDEWSSRALQLGPELKPLVCTRGAVLVELGHHEKGKALLAAMEAEGQLKSIDLLMNRIFLARAEYALGDRTAAQRFADAARTIAKTEPASPIIAAALARLEPELAATA